MRSFTAFSAFISLAILLLGQFAYASPVLSGGPQSMATDASAAQPATTNAERILRPLHVGTLLRRGKVNDAALQPEVVDSLSKADTLLRRGHVKGSAGTASAPSSDDSEPAVTASSGQTSNPPLQLSQADTLLRRDNVGSGPAITDPPLHLSNADTLRRGNVEAANSGPITDDNGPTVADDSEPGVADASEPAVADASEPDVADASATASPTLHFL
ncbi:hypothetical protein CVT26_012722 [Gymnopilus dilepis]|uniref:Uncharacterized protein n=1 Tax=Gymnopilus dilepis TaxID=231916 RepID=A0A409YPF3_9AGAR|nr:hypothetical protein CVT26_012722 [Gymnopilus dilepis]